MRKLLQYLLCLSVIFAASTAAIGSAPLYRLTSLGDLGGGYSNPCDINDRGQVVGYSFVGDGTEHAFVWQDGTMRDIGTLGGRDSYAYGINNSGQISGRAWNERGHIHAFFYDGVMHDLGFEGTAYDVNESGRVVGETSTQGFIAYGGGVTFFRHSGDYGGDDTHAYAINDSNNVVGYIDVISQYVAHPEPFLWNNGNFWDLGVPYGFFAATAYDINNLGWVVGSSVGQSGSASAVLWRGYERIILDDLGTHTRAKGLNDYGVIIGHSGGRQVVWIDGVVYDLSNSVDASGAGWGISEVNAINNLGQIVGMGYSPTGQHQAILLTPVPEPSSLYALVYGLCGVCGLLYPRRKELGGNLRIATSRPDEDF